LQILLVRFADLRGFNQGSTSIRTEQVPGMTSLRLQPSLSLVALLVLPPLGAARAETTLLNVSYDPTRKLYRTCLESQDRRNRHHQPVARRLQ